MEKTKRLDWKSPDQTGRNDEFALDIGGQRDKEGACQSGICTRQAQGNQLRERSTGIASPPAWDCCGAGSSREQATGWEMRGMGVWKGTTKGSRKGI
jgi:hypothetical protein